MLPSVFARLMRFRPCFIVSLQDVCLPVLNLPAIFFFKFGVFTFALLDFFAVPALPVGPTLSPVLLAQNVRVLYTVGLRHKHNEMYLQYIRTR